MWLKNELVTEKMTKLFLSYSRWDDVETIPLALALMIFDFDFYDINNIYNAWKKMSVNFTYFFGGVIQNFFPLLTMLPNINKMIQLFKDNIIQIFTFHI